MISKQQKNPRIKRFHYSENGYYFVTNNTHFSKPTIQGKIKEIIRTELMDLERRFSGVTVYYYSLMPTHIHVIIGLQNADKSIPTIWRVFKSITTVKARKNDYKDAHLWQLNYFEHIIRNEAALERITEYIRNNPFKENIALEQIYGDRLPNIKL